VRHTLRLRMVLIVCGVSALSTTLALALHDRSLSRDLEEAARARLERAARATSRLAEGHLDAMVARYQAISGTPQLRASLEVGHAATLAHYAETLRERQGAARIVFLDAQGRVVGGAGDSGLDAPALGVERAALIVHEGRPFAVASVALGPGEERRGRLVGIEPLRDATLDEWSDSCAAEVFFADAQTPGAGGALEAVARGLGAFELRVASSLDAERAALRSARWNLLVAGLIALAAALAASRVASRSVVQPILRLKAAAARIGSGDLSARVGILRGDEIGDVARAFDQMAADLRSTLGQVAGAADRLESTAGHVATLSEGVARATGDQVREGERVAGSMALVKRQLAQLGASAADSLRTLNEAVDGSSVSFRELGKAGSDLSRNADQLVARVVEIARSIDETLASARNVSRSTESLTDAAEETLRSMEQMARGMREADEHLGETTALSRRVLEAAETGRAKVRETTEGLQAIHAASSAAEETIRELAAHAEGIGEIVDVIDGVAEDSGLLALNAAIIAAQAGEQGRAFAVVAHEIRDFAGRVRASTKQISELVHRVQKGTADACTAVARGAHSVRRGVGIAAAAGQALDAIAEAAQESAARTAQVVGSSAGQSEAVRRVSEQMARVREGVELIRRAGAAQEALHESVRSASSSVRDVAADVSAATEGQARGTARIGESIETVRAAVEYIGRALEEQLGSIRQAGEFLEGARGYTTLTQDSARQIDEAMRGLRAQAAQLRARVAEFRL
jgi:methyl-accepting chemotaxis protein